MSEKTTAPARSLLSVLMAKASFLSRQNIRTGIERLLVDTVARRTFGHTLDQADSF
jgi:hypothetical protein